jgi:hypothetical protein
MKILLIHLYLLAAMLVGGIFGIAGAMVPAVLLWGPRILDSALGSPPDRSHPAFLLGLVLLGPCVVFGCVAGVMLLFLPVALRYPTLLDRIRFAEGFTVRALAWYGHHIADYAARLERLPSSRR